MELTTNSAVEKVQNKDNDDKDNIFTTEGLLTAIIDDLNEKDKQISSLQKSEAITRQQIAKILELLQWRISRN